MAERMDNSKTKSASGRRKRQNAGQKNAWTFDLLQRSDLLLDGGEGNVFLLVVR